MRNFTAAPEDANALSTEIVRLSDAWYSVIGGDHHKDRDCHWNVDVDFAYGNPPRFTASHAGYIWEDWTGPERSTMVAALRDLRGALVNALRDELAIARRDVAETGPDDSLRDECDRRRAEENIIRIITALGEET